MERKTRVLLLITILIIIFKSSNANASELQLKDTEYFRVTETYKVYEFNIGYVKVSQYNVYDMVPLSADSQIINRTMFPKNIVGPSQYDTSDFYDLNYSPNIKLNNIKFMDDSWRGTIYYCPSMSFEFSDTNEDVKTGSFWVAYKLKRLPHLHTREKLIPNKEFHVGINSDPYRGLKKYFTILAFPAGTELTEIFHYLPLRQESNNNRIFLIYDLTEIKENVGYHVKFILPDNNIPELDLTDLIQIMEK
ncbi:MAG: hypothetical protein PHX78_05580 [bacterium]|nr:hypothetical protein [bacterium]